MSCTISFHPVKALPFLSPPKCKPGFSVITCAHKKQPSNNGSNISLKLSNDIKSNWVFQFGLLATTVAEPALAVTGVNNQEDLIWVLLKAGVVGFCYFLIMPPIIMNWLRIRWYRRNLLEMYFQFMFVFIFFPGILVWAPFLNFRKFPRDPTMKYPWSKPENPSEVKGGFLKYPWATIEDYE
ncbi:NAD(P)H-quinone oxidoreductase subunit L, chloroplastic isoform X2 [Spinacia oleracea]|uniref:NAD(P)H-quinone oxidoreductase subunit L, chloroplastic isoform X2 n=2 Tax=Spinacia oleracea TaxID=3562 RepID=A0ABM3R1E5_SPIOL|nr:NAD(P)H-quinone oxidoreductase subunit L, chloroplastic isoform X2 [Spinacia oleracea]